MVNIEQLSEQQKHAAEAVAQMLNAEYVLQIAVAGYELELAIKKYIEQQQGRALKEALDAVEKPGAFSTPATSVAIMLLFAKAEYMTDVLCYHGQYVANAKLHLKGAESDRTNTHTKAVKAMEIAFKDKTERDAAYKLFRNNYAKLRIRNALQGMDEQVLTQATKQQVLAQIASWADYIHVINE